MDTQLIFALIIDEFGADVLHDELKRLQPRALESLLERVCYKLDIDTDEIKLITEGFTDD